MTNVSESPSFFLSGNPLRCDCHLHWVKRGGHDGGHGHRPTVADYASVHCINAANETRAVSEVSDDAFVCPYTSRCLDGCLCCDFIACDCQVKCPPGCHCSRDERWEENVVECKEGGRDRVPEVRTAMQLWFGIGLK